MTEQNLPPSILTQLQEPLTAEEKLWALNLPLEFRRRLTELEGKMLSRLSPKKWPEELRKKAERYIELDEE